MFFHIDAELAEEEEQNTELEGGVQSVAEAYPNPSFEEELEQNDDEEQTFDQVPNRKNPNVVPLADEVPEVPVRDVPTTNRKTPVQSDEEDEDEYPVRTKSRGPAGATYFPVTFGSTNGGAIAIANSYSTGKGNF